MPANIVACQSMLVRSVQLETEGKLTDAQAAIVKAFCTAKAPRRQANPRSSPKVKATIHCQR